MMLTRAQPIRVSMWEPGSTRAMLSSCAQSLLLLHGSLMDRGAPSFAVRGIGDRNSVQSAANGTVHSRSGTGICFPEAVRHGQGSWRMGRLECSRARCILLCRCAAHGEKLTSPV